MVDPWHEIEKITGVSVPDWVKEAFQDPKLIYIPCGRILYAAGSIKKEEMRWGAFEELDDSWYERGNQLNRDWYIPEGDKEVEVYEYSTIITRSTPAVMGKVADQQGAARHIGPSKFQYYNPVGLGSPKRGRLLGLWRSSKE